VTVLRCRRLRRAALLSAGVFVFAVLAQPRTTSTVRRLHIQVTASRHHNFPEAGAGESAVTLRRS
jgi:hypothetical protein